MCMHGIYSWVSPHNRRVLVSLIRKKLKPGGLLYISYDCMPGWAGIAPLRRILVQGFAPRPGLSSTAALDQALALVQQDHGRDIATTAQSPGRR